MIKNFIVQSTENSDPKKYYCEFINSISLSKDKPCGILVYIDPPIPADDYPGDKTKNIFAPNLVDEDLNMLMLAPRLEGSIVYPKISDPCYVYMCVPKKGGNWENGPWDILDWGEIKMLTD